MPKIKLPVKDFTKIIYIFFYYRLSLAKSELLTFPHIFGVEGIRTLNLLDANQTLSQLSYDPVNVQDVVPAKSN